MRKLIMTIVIVFSITFLSYATVDESTVEFENGFSDADYRNIDSIGLRAWIRAEISEMQLDEMKAVSDMTGLDLETVKLVYEYSERTGVKSDIVFAIIEKESNFDRFAVGTSNDRGYMQIIPSTEKAIARKFGGKFNLTYDRSMIFEPEYNIGLGVLYLEYLLEKNEGDYERSISEYNRGDKSLQSYYKRNGSYSTSYSKDVLEISDKYSNI